MAVSKKRSEPTYQFVQETYGLEDCYQALEGEARLYCRRGVSASGLSDVVFVCPEKQAW